MMHDDDIDDPLIGKDGRILKRPAMPGAGRPLGAINKFTRDLKEAMLEAATLSDYAKGDDTHGTLTSYCVTVANKHPELFFQAVSKLLPKEVRTHLQSDSTIGVNVVFETVDQVAAELERSGMSHQQVNQLKRMLPMPVIDNEPLDEELHDEDRDDHD
jgi:hypothetical protein